MSVVDRARELFRRTRKAPNLSTSVVHHSLADDYVFDALVDRSTMFAEHMNEKPIVEGPNGPVTMELAPHLWADAFKGLHNNAPEVSLRDRIDVRPDHGLHLDVMDALSVSPDWKAAKAMSRGDERMAAMCAVKAKEAGADAMRDLLKEQAERQEQMRQEIERIETAEADAADVREIIARDGVSDGLKRTLRAIAEDKSDARRKLGELIVAEELAQGETNQAAEIVAARAAESANQMAQVWRALPGNARGERTEGDFDDAMRIGSLWKNSDELRKLALLCGRVMRSQKAAKRRDVTHGREKRVGIETGNDMRRVLSSELALRRRSGTRRLFLKRYADGGLLQHKTEGIERAGLGPAVIALDGSSSMKTACGDGMTRWIGAKAVTFALVANTYADGRPTYIIVFNRSVMQVYEFDGRTMNLALLTDFARLGASGGTDITVAMRRAEQVIDGHEGFDKADVVLMTDGADRLEAEDLAIRDRLRARGVQIHGVTIGRLDTQYTNEMCDDTVSVMDLSGPSAATDHLALVSSAT